MGAEGVVLKVSQDHRTLRPRVECGDPRHLGGLEFRQELDESARGVGHFGVVAKAELA
jgi:hypothetical protein